MRDGCAPPSCASPRPACLALPVAAELVLSSVYPVHEHIPHAVHTAEEVRRRRGGWVVAPLPVAVGTQRLPWLPGLGAVALTLHPNSFACRPACLPCLPPQALSWTSISILSLFVIELAARLVVWGHRYFTQSWWCGPSARLRRGAAQRACEQRPPQRAARLPAPGPLERLTPCLHRVRTHPCRHSFDAVVVVTSLTLELTLKGIAQVRRGKLRCAALRCAALRRAVRCCAVLRRAALLRAMPPWRCHPAAAQPPSLPRRLPSTALATAAR